MSSLFLFLLVSLVKTYNCLYFVLLRPPYLFLVIQMMKTLDGIYFCFTDYAKALTVWIKTNCGKFLKRREYQTTLPASWETCVQVKKQQLETDMEQETGSKSGKEYVKAVYCYPAYLTSMQSTSCEMLGWMKHKLESRLLGETSITSDMQMTPS